MISSRAPVRISLAGGGTDMPAFYEHEPGIAISVAINRYAHATALKPLDGGVRLASEDLNARARYRSGQRPAVSGRLAFPAAVIEHFWDAGIRDMGIDLTVRCDVEPGTGLGTSGAVLVAMIGAVSRYCDQSLSQVEIADLACRLEMARLRRPVGKQDQYASAFGGLHAFSFTPERVEVEPLRVPGGGLPELARWLLLFRIGATRDAAEILSRQTASLQHDPDVRRGLEARRDLAVRAREELLAGNLHTFGRLLDEGWRIKKALSDAISTPVIDEAYATAKASGALGGKLCGAGGGGYLLLCCPPEERRYLRVMMSRLGLDELPFTFDLHGVRSGPPATSPSDSRSSTRSLRRRR